MLASDVPCEAAAVFTRNNFPAAPLVVGREHLANGMLQAVVVNSKNANAATGEGGIADARRICRLIGEALEIPAERVLPSSTGVIGEPLPMDVIEAACRGVREGLATGAEAIESFARAIMTTDTRPKAASARVGGATLTGITKGAGMIEPHMATMLAYLVTDAALPAADLGPMLKAAVDASFNRVSIDSDTSTNDTVAILANGHAGAVDPEEFARALGEVSEYLAKEIVRDGEGAT